MSDITTGNSGCCEDPASKNKILMLGPLPPTVGGITTFIRGVTESELNKKYTLVLYGTERPTFGLVREVDDYTLMFRIGLMCLIKAAMTTISHILKFPLVLIMERPDIVHIHTASYWSFWENAIYGVISKLFCRKVIIHIHGGMFYKFYKDSNIFVRFLIRKVLKTPDRIIVLSSRWKNLFMDILDTRVHTEDRIIVLENFVVFSRFAHVMRKFDVSDGTINVLFVGGVGARAKGLYDVLKVIPIVVKECKNISFSLVACGNINKPNFVGSKEIYISHTKFLDYVSGDRKIKVFTSADIFVLPSYFEGLPITILEAMASGLPVIATSVGSIPEVVEEGRNGFLIQVGDCHALAEKILLLARDNKLRQEIATNNMDKIRKRYDRTLVMQKLGYLYDQLLRTRTSA